MTTNSQSMALKPTNFYFIGSSVLLVLIMLLGLTPFQALASHNTSKDTDSSSADYKDKVSVWIPWWSDTEGLKSATKNIKKIDAVHPFVFEVGGMEADIVDKANLNERQWKNFLRLARKNDVEVIPTIAWFDGAQIDYILSDKKRRAEHIEKIVDMVDDGRFDGVNIDYEQKLAKNIDDFSVFLKELNKALGKKTLTCAIEARTPADSRYKEIPVPLTYANDYSEINKYCDRIELMTYDQQRDDLKLNAKRLGYPYMPVADKEWVEKVLENALKDFDEDKVSVGVATYGRAWDITVAPEWFRDYNKVATLNQPRIKELSEDIYKAPIGRSAGGEAVMSYFPEDSIFKVLNALPVPEGTPTGMEAAAKALLFANATEMEVPVRFITYNDAKSAEDKLALVKKYGLYGVAVFKVDGEEDPDLWKLF
ncbi:hypothetical protein KC845_03505 [Candidatus Kaiserbacteria bacterium]|nr:hypothetical protein [Candidatus Kaiserbacteria bacterium]